MAFLALFLKRIQIKAPEEIFHILLDQSERAYYYNHIIKLVILRACKLIEMHAQATLTFVLYIRDSIALRFEPLRECMKMVRKSH